MNRAVIPAAIVIGLIAIAVPRLGERYRPESRAIGVLRAIVSAQMAYAQVNGGNYGMLDCMVPSCTPSLANLAPLLSPDLTTLHERGGYRFEFQPYPEPGAADRNSRAALTRFAVVATPIADRHNHRAFCVDNRETIYVSEGDVSPEVDRGRCVDTAKPLQSTSSF